MTPEEPERCIKNSQTGKQFSGELPKARCCGKRKRQNGGTLRRAAEDEFQQERERRPDAEVHDSPSLEET